MNTAADVLCEFGLVAELEANGVGPAAEVVSVAFYALGGESRDLRDVFGFGNCFYAWSKLTSKSKSNEDSIALLTGLVLAK